MRGAGFGCVPFAVYDAITCRHRLHFIRPQNVGFPRAVPVQQPAFENVCDDFHVSVRVRPEPFAGGDAIVVEHPQHTEVHMRGIVIVGERE